MKIITQIGILFAVCLAGQALASLLPFAFPASVMGMLLLFLLLYTRLLRQEQIGELSGFLLKNMAILFVPSGVGILESLPALRGRVLPLLAICLATTVLTFAATAFTVRGVIRLQERFAARSRAGFPGKEVAEHV